MGLRSERGPGPGILMGSNFSSSLSLFPLLSQWILTCTGLSWGSRTMSPGKDLCAAQWTLVWTVTEAPS
jgi:hypothetical protein